ncbi:CobT-like cobalamin biosynthesis protein [Rhodococcus phage Reynauld]|uniref:CobT-like cobalamin biosynthesis protein n=1 Tax=Rhodococcus phage Reynauld TaxID=3062845 RepID=A0ACD4UIA1_9CAUD|nr:CobT-like cobalamin biosynthesis protein [Rhodococcus phage Reynauld]
MNQLERAGRAVTAFRQMLPSLTAFATMAAGRPVTVQVGASPATKAGVIWLRPPMALAEQVAHDPRRCDRRVDWEMVCPACRQLDEVYGSIYHEIAHITEKSEAVLTGPELDRAAAEGAAAGGTPGYQRWIATAAGGPDCGVYEYADVMSPYLTAMVQVADDIRVEHASYAARPGVEGIRYALVERLLERGIELEDGTVSWIDRPLEEQVPVALLSAAMRHSLDGRFHPEAIDAVAAAGELIDVIPRTGLGVLELAVAMLGALHAHGVYELPIPEDEDDDDTELLDDSGSAGDSAGDSQDADDSPVPMGDETGEGGADFDEGESGEEPGGGTGEPDREPEPDAGDEGAPEAPAADSPDATGDAAGGDSETGDGDGDDQGGAGDRAPDAEPGGAEPGGAEPGPGGADQEAGATGDHEVPDAGDDDSEGGDGRPGAPVAGPDVGGPGGGDADAHPAHEASGGAAEHGPVEPGQILAALEQISGHAEVGEDEDLDTAVLALAIEQSEVFDNYSLDVGGIRIHRRGEGDAYSRFNRHWTKFRHTHQPVPEVALADSVRRARQVFSESRLDRNVRNLRRGKLDPRTLAKRGWGDDDRVFRKKLRAEGVDFEVVIGMDISGSTADGCIELIREAAEAMGNVLHRVGVDFSVYAHTTSGGREDDPTLMQRMYEVKRTREPWTQDVRASLAGLLPCMSSVDGHNLEFYRKVLDRSRARRKALVYFTDGEIPAVNPEEEKRIIVREAEIYASRGYTVMAVGIGNDSPKDYGLDTIRIDRADDIVTVLVELEKRITAT